MLDINAYRARPLYVTRLQRAIEKIDPSQRREIRIRQIVDERGRCRALKFPVPSGRELADSHALIKRYVLAMINNMMVSFAGAKMELYCDKSEHELTRILEEAIESFDLASPRNNRKGYGVYVNYTNRMNAFLGLGRFSMELRDISEWRDIAPGDIYYVSEPGDEAEELALLRRSARELEGKRFCSLDVGGNSIKGAVVEDGRVIVLKEYKWYPSGCRLAEEMNGPQLLMLRYLALAARIAASGEAPGALESGATYEQVEAECLRMEKSGLRAKGAFDGIVIGFPDIVVHGKIAGGESFKHLGMKTNPDVDYEIEFAKTSSLDDLARPYIKPGGEVIVLNDGNAASFITSVERAFDSEAPDIGEYGMFVNTIGTEMGTGFVSRGGTIQHIPLEGFQHVIDLGNTDLARFPAADVRSLNSMNTGIPGTVQKYISQLGLFRMMVNALIEKRPGEVDNLVGEGLLRREGDMLIVCSEPADRRGELTRRFIGMLESGDELAEAAFFTMGEALGVLIELDRQIFPEIAPVRLLSGGIVASDKAFSALVKGLSNYNPDYKALRLDEKTMRSPLLQSLKSDQRNFNVAVGSAYIANRFLLKEEHE